MPQKDKPTPIRLGEFKPRLQMQAAEQDRSLHYWVLKIIKENIDKYDSKKVRKSV